MSAIDDAPGRGGRRTRIGVICDLAGEQWPSMELVAQMLLSNLSAYHAGEVAADMVRPRIGDRPCTAQRGSFRWKLSTLRRLVDRTWRYPRWLSRRAADYDVFHVVDHSYAHLVHVLPASRTVVTCHDTEIFAKFIGRRGASRMPGALVGPVLEGLRRAAVVACVSRSTRDDLVATRLVSPDRLVVVPNGVHPACSPAADDEADRRAAALLGPAGGRVDLLHVGVPAPRKRIDVLLAVVGAIQRDRPDVRLVRVGGPLPPAQRGGARRAGLGGALVELPFLEPPVLAAVYRRAALLLLTSEREGFGLPVVEALACGTPVVATDLPVMREVGGAATTYCPLADIDGWRRSILALLEERGSAPTRWRERCQAAVSEARRFSWRQHADAMTRIYGELASTPDGEAGARVA